MAKNKNKQNGTVVENERNEEIITVLNEANEDQVIEIDTSALDKELKSSEGGASLVMPIRGGYSDKSNKKDKKDDKKEEKSSGLKSIFSMFLKGEAEAEEVTCKSVDEIREVLESEDIVSLGKFTRKHPEILETYFKSIGGKVINDEVVDVEIEVENVPEYKEEKKMNKLAKVELNKKERKELRETIAEVMESLNSKLSVKELFEVVEEELGVDIVKIVNTLLDKLDSYDVDEFNRFIKKTVKNLQGTDLVKFIEYLTGEDIIKSLNYLFDNGEDGYENIKETVTAKVQEIIEDEKMVKLLSKEFEDEEEMFLECIKAFIKIAKKNIKKEKKVSSDDNKSKSIVEDNLDALSISFNKIFFGGNKPKVKDEVDEEKSEPKKISPDELMQKALALMAK